MSHTPMSSPGSNLIEVPAIEFDRLMRAYAELREWAESRRAPVVLTERDPRMLAVLSALDALEKASHGIH